MTTQEKIYHINGHELLLRNPSPDDAQMLLDYLKTTSGETPYLIREPEEITLTVEKEREFIQNGLDSDCEEMLIGFWDGEYVGNCALVGSQRKRYAHRASVAIALYLKFTGLGIGTIMLEALFEIARQKGLEQLELEVVTTNEPALALYKKMGFEICGTSPHNMKYKDGSYADIYWMAKKL